MACFTLFLNSSSIIHRGNGGFVTRTVNFSPRPTMISECYNATATSSSSTKKLPPSPFALTLSEPKCNVIEKISCYIIFCIFMPVWYNNFVVIGVRKFFFVSNYLLSGCVSFLISCLLLFKFILIFEYSRVYFRVSIQGFFRCFSNPASFSASTDILLSHELLVILSKRS